MVLFYSTKKQQTKYREKHLNSLNSEMLKVGLKYTRKDKIHDKLHRQ